MHKASLIVLFLVGGCTSSPMIYVRADQDVDVRMFGDAHLERDEGVAEVTCDGHPGETLLLYFLRKGYYPQIWHVKIPEKELEQKPGPWKKLPDDQQGVWAGVNCTYGAGGRHVSVFFFEEFLRNHKMTIELDGKLTEITTDKNAVFMLLLPPGDHQVKIDWNPDIFGHKAGTINIQPSETTILDICKLTTLVD
jgi:hypothetical protein